jgi:FlaA1/EpsC-like NDP-sugar epimerase
MVFGWLSRISDPSQFSRTTKRVVMVVADVMMIPAALWGAFAMRLGSSDPHLSQFGWMFPLAVMISLPVFVRLGLYRAIVRFVGQQALVTILKAVTISVVLLAATVLFTRVPGVPRSVLIIYWALLLIYLSGSRLAMRNYFQLVARARRPKQPVIIYGAGESGAQLASALKRGIEFEPAAFVDDNDTLVGRDVDGVPVYHADRLPSLVEQVPAVRVLLAMPSLTGAKRRKVLERVEPLSVHVMTVPEVGDLVSGVARVSQVREVDIGDLLGRDPVPPDAGLLNQCIRGKSVLVTGAGGSIGSELCRQIIRLEPKRLVVLDISEIQLYEIKRKLRNDIDRNGFQVEVDGVLGSALDRSRLEMAMRAFGVQTVYHAAAYKHVPIVERNVTEGVRNNIFGTWRTAEAAMSAGVETFVLISTDKAVRPTNIMGATKRFAELVLQGLAKLNSNTRFSMVRFGNVLDSSGSVVPLFREQIRSGGPVTVTHPDIIRYFMTIPEAAQLVIQAGSMGQGGDVFVLDMGEPVQIADLARRMVGLMGLEVADEEHPDGDIAIEYTGLRPGEKLYEELLIGDNVSGTQHPAIMRAEEVDLAWADLLEWLRRLEQAVERNDCGEIREILLLTVNGYVPADDIVDKVWTGAEPPLALSEGREHDVDRVYRH